MAKPKSLRVQLIAAPEFMARVDEWRRKQPDLPNRSEAIRRLIERSLDSEQK